MTLSKQPVKRKPVASKKRSAGHHHRGSHYIKSYWPYLPMAIIVSAGILLNSWIGSVNGSVLSYATNISHSGLLSGTNSERAANGLASLSSNSQLNTAAQNKAADMAANDYWAHTSPSGVTPWYWITASGYKYQTAGENLAYGFLTSSETIAGWMASPGHRANILNASFTEVGFGFVNVENYQGNGQQTIVVAMYASPYVSPKSTPAPAPTPTPAPAPTPTPSAVKPATKSPVATQPEQPTTAEESPAPTNETPPAVEEKEDTITPVATTKNNDPTPPKEPASKSVTRVEVITSANIAWTQFAVSMLVSMSILVFLLRHSFAWHKVLAKGEKFILHHPLLDIAFVTIATLGVIMLQTSGVIL